MFKWHYSDTN